MTECWLYALQNERVIMQLRESAGQAGQVPAARWECHSDFPVWRRAVFLFLLLQRCRCDKLAPSSRRGPGPALLHKEAEFIEPSFEHFKPPAVRFTEDVVEFVEFPVAGLEVLARPASNASDCIEFVEIPVEPAVPTSGSQGLARGPQDQHSQMHPRMLTEQLRGSFKDMSRFYAGGAVMGGL